MSTLIEEIFNSVLEGEAPKTKESVQAALQTGVDPAVVLNEGMIAAMREVGRRFEEGEYFVPEMLIAARAMKGGMEILKPHLISSDVKSAGKVVIGTVKGDLHDIGKNLVSLMLEGAGFEVKDMGVDVSAEKFVEAVRANNADIVALSALLTTTMPSMVTTIEALKQAGLRDKVKVIIGGAPVTETYARQIGADGTSTDASRAVSLAKSLMGVA